MHPRTAGITCVNAHPRPTPTGWRGGRRYDGLIVKTRVTSHERLRLEVLKQFRVVSGVVHRHFRAIERRCGLSGAQVWMLHELVRTPEIGVTELAAQLSIHQSTASQLIEKLVRSGYVERAGHAVDRRRVHLRLSRRGVALTQRLPRPAEGVLPNALDRLPDASLRALRTQLSRLIAHMEGP